MKKATLKQLNDLSFEDAKKVLENLNYKQEESVYDNNNTIKDNYFALYNDEGDEIDLISFTEKGELIKGEMGDEDEWIRSSGWWQRVK